MFYYVITIGYALTELLNWFYNIGIVTKTRLIDIDYSHVTHKSIAITRIGDIVDAEYKQGGFLGNIFNYGDIFIQTEGLKPNFEFPSVPQPAEIIDIIIDLKSKDQNAA